jgi:hypothetical protein
VVFDADEQLAEEGRESEGEERNREGCDGGPEQGGVPLPEPELADKLDRMFAGAVEEFAGGERHGRGVEEMAGDTDEGDDQDQLKRVDDVVAKLRGGYVETEDESSGEAEDRGAAQDGVDADEEASGDAPGQFLRCGSHAQERENRQNDAAVRPVVMDGSGALTKGGRVWFAGLHC